MTSSIQNLNNEFRKKTDFLQNPSAGMFAHSSVTKFQKNIYLDFVSNLSYIKSKQENKQKLAKIGGPLESLKKASWGTPRIEDCYVEKLFTKNCTIIFHSHCHRLTRASSDDAK